MSKVIQVVQHKCMYFRITHRYMCQLDMNVHHSACCVPQIPELLPGMTQITAKYRECFNVKITSMAELIGTTVENDMRVDPERAKILAENLRDVYQRVQNVAGGRKVNNLPLSSSSSPPLTPSLYPPPSPTHPTRR